MTTNIITLSNGKKVANFSSPHPFMFTDGSMLESQSNAVAEKLKVDFIETELGTNGDIILDFSLSTDVKNAMQHYMDLWVTKQVDIVFCPLPMITAIKQSTWFGPHWLRESPFRSIRIDDRINKLVSVTKQCI
jgi:hypothetical protein